MSSFTPLAAITCFINYDGDVTWSLKQEISDMVMLSVPYTCPSTVVTERCILNVSFKSFDAIRTPSLQLKG